MAASVSGVAVFDETHFYHPSIPDAPFALDAEESRHLRRVLRLAEGAVITVTDGAGTLADAAACLGHPDILRAHAD